MSLKELVNEIFESLQLGEGDTIEKFSAKGKSTGKLKQGTIRKKLGVKKGERIPTSKLDKEIARLRRKDKDKYKPCLLYTSPSPRDRQKSRMPSSA